ncbi:MAG TPA: imidazolonepropionase [Deltaproteobacteria bacterium]|nr:imidazolonepropionase [Deltaproteobacteria bacterium]
MGEIELVVKDLACLLTMDPSLGDGSLGQISDAAVAFSGGRVAWLGSSAQAPDAPTVRSLPGTIGLPGLVECHTHAVWAGSRADELLRRLAGEDYSAILESGGGILSTVAATRASSEDVLAELAAARLVRLRSRGVTTVEIKSGYGLSPADEAKLLRAARRAGQLAGVRVLTTFLGAHTVPASHRSRRAGYVREVIEAQLPLAAPHADFVDVYVDRGAFTVDEGEAILRAGQALGLGVRIHAEQVTLTGAAAMAAGLGALSADHLERIDEAGIAAMARAGTIAVLLPGAMLYLRDRPPPVAALREAGVPLAVATDLNPGTSPVYDPWTVATLAAITMGLTIDEVLLGITSIAGRALGRPELGRLIPGGPGDLVVMRPPPGEPPSAAALIQQPTGSDAMLVISGGHALP